MSRMDAWYDKDVTIARATKQGDGRGGQTSTMATIGTATGRIIPISQDRRIKYQQLDYKVTHDVFMPAGTDVQEEDQLTAGGKTYRVHKVPDPDNSHHLEIEAEELR